VIKYDALSTTHISSLWQSRQLAHGTNSLSNSYRS